MFIQIIMIIIGLAPGVVDQPKGVKMMAGGGHSLTRAPPLKSPSAGPGLPGAKLVFI